MRNIGTYRMQVYDGRTTGMHWQRHKGGAQHYRVAERLGKRLEVAVALGPEPVLPYCATAPMPEGLDELLLGGFLARRRIEMVKCVSVDLEVPASSQIVLEGYVEPGERRREGPFGDHTGFYSQPDDFPVFHLTCLTRRKKPTYLTTVVGIPPMEDFYLGLASERIFLPMIRKTLPEIVDMHFPGRGHLPQPRHRLDRQALSRPRAQDHERLLGARAAHVLEDDHRRRQGRERARSEPGRVDRRHAHRSAPRRPDDEGPGRRSGRRGRSAGVRRQDGHRRDAAVGVGRLHAHVAGAGRDDGGRRPPRGRDHEEDRHHDPFQSPARGLRRSAPSASSSARRPRRPTRPTRSPRSSRASTARSAPAG